MTDTNGQKKSTDIVFQKFYRKGRFITFSYWPEGNKIAVDIGQFDDNNKLLNNTKCYLNPLPFYTYLQSEVIGSLDIIFPGFDTYGFSVFGGSNNVARVFKSHWWMKGTAPDRTARIFKCGHFEAKPGSQKGEIVPDMSKQISLSSSKMSLEEIAQVYNAMSALMIKFPDMMIKGTTEHDD